MFDNNKRNGQNNSSDKEDCKNSTSNIASSIVLDSTIKIETAEANAKFYKPKYNPQSRKAFYDDSNAHKKAIENAFSSNRTATDPYTGQPMVSNQKDAKLLYGQDWQYHAGEADHIEPLNEIVNQSNKNPFLKPNDIKDIANADDNFQVIARTTNQTSKTMGKGGSSQSEWAADDTRMQGLADHSASYESKESIRNRVKNIGKTAKQKNNARIATRTVSNMAKTAHKAGMAGAKNASAMSAAMSGIMNIVAVINGEKTAEDAIMDTAADTGKAAVSGYVMSGGLTTLYQALSGSSSKFIQALTESNIPGKIITAVILTGNTLKRYGNGEISTQECLLELGEKGLTFATTGYSMAVGQALIPIPIVGAAVGALVGATLTNSYFNHLMQNLKQKELEHEERIRIIEECQQASIEMQRFRTELEQYLQTYFREYQTCFDNALSLIHTSFEAEDSEGIIAGANQITRKLGGTVNYETTDEFKKLVISNKPFVL